MKIAILYICTGEYYKFWSDFYSSCEKHFCKDVQKHYFVFTDTKKFETNNTLTIIHQDNLGWPFNTLYRYRMFSRIKEQLANFDYIVFFNANCQFIVDVSLEEFFGIDKKLVACLHPGFYNKVEPDFTYERRKSSMAYVEKGKYYFAGGICGGRRDDFLKMSLQLLQAIEKDLDNGLMALWHDESYWNAYLNLEIQQLEHNVNILEPAYLYPEGRNLPYKPKILLIHKPNIINVNTIKFYTTNSFISWCKEYIIGLMARYKCYIK
ncbi:MAG: family 6 glucosyltransferase [Sulfurospirillaceae bacterium]|nr:family 6 glucosyltransferase [Sulfurospirillaceae bacterium]MDD2826332.1 family 6 glucosyltransferase [Sulfurospirillaceae bacterium]